MDTNVDSWLTPGTAVILDTETTDLTGVVIELSAIDAATGETLINTFVDPAGAPISDESRAVHQITNDMLTGAPAWSRVLEQLAAAIGDRTILAYNAEFDRAAIARTCAAANVPPGHLADPSRWGCILAARTAATGRRLRLNGGHRALGDCVAARDILADCISSAKPQNDSKWAILHRISGMLPARRRKG